MTMPCFTTPRLVLAELAPGDAAGLQAFQAHPAYCRFQAVEPAEFADAARRIQGYLAHRGPDDRRRLYVWTARSRVDGAVVGSVSLTLARRGVAALGLGIDHGLAGRGLATEMAGVVIEHGFGALGLHRIEADVAVEHAACRRVLAKLGFSLEGIARERIHAQGRWWSEALFARLAGDPTPG